MGRARVSTGSPRGRGGVAAARASADEPRCLRTVEQTIPEDEAHRSNRMHETGGADRPRMVMLPRLTGSGPTRVVVTGGAGFIGSHLCEALLARDSHVTCVDNLVGSTGLTRNIDHLIDDHAIRVRRRERARLGRRADLTGVDCVFHQAASKNSVALDDPEHDLAVNGLGTLRLLLRCARDDVRKFVHASTGSVFGETNQPHDDRIPKRPVSLYGTSKLAASATAASSAGPSGSITPSCATTT